MEIFSLLVSLLLQTTNGHRNAELVQTSMGKQSIKNVSRVVLAWLPLAAGVEARVAKSASHAAMDAPGGPPKICRSDFPEPRSVPAGDRSSDLSRR
jgi:hypothetical protein